MRAITLVVSAIVVAGLVLFWTLKSPASPAAANAAYNEKSNDAATTPRQVSDRVRTAFQEGRHVRVEYRPDDGSKVGSPHWSRKLTERDLRYCKRQVSRILKTTDKVFQLDIDDPVERERRMAELFRIRVQCEAVQRLLGDAKGFMTKSLIPELQSDGDWFYWNMMVQYKDEGSLVLYVPIDLKQFPDVKDWRKRSAEINEFAEQDKGFKWNALDYDERRRLVDGAEKARAAIPSLRERIEAIRSTPVAQRTAAQQNTYTQLTGELDAAYEAERLVPPYYDPATLEWRFRGR